MKTTLSIITAVFLLATGGWVSGAESPQAEFQKGLIEEEANRNLDAAIQAYQSVLKQLDEQRKLAATTIFRLGECYRKLGKTNEATAQYQRVVREFSDQDVLAKLSRQNLGALGDPSQSRPAKPELLQVALPDEETTEIERLRKIIRNSPDLVNAPQDADGTPLQKAAKKGQLAVVKFLLDSRADPNVGALYNAAAAGHRGVVELLLSHGADVNSVYSGATALHMAVDRGFRSVAETLIAAKADVNAKRAHDGETPLGLAVLSQGQPLVELLLSHGANPNAKDNEGRAPLHLATTRGDSRFVELLVAKGALVNATDNHGQTPLYRAVEYGRVQTTEALLRAGADPNAKISTFIEREVTRPEMIRTTGSSPSGPSRFSISCNEFTPLHLAAVIGNEPLVRLLITHKADVNARASQERTPVNLAVTYATPPIAKALLENGADVNAVSSESPDTPLITAVRRRSEEMVSAILAREPNLEQRDTDGLTALQVAASRAAERIQELLLDAGANPNVINERDGATPLHWAVSNRNKQIVEALLKHKANPNAADLAGKTPLDYAKSLGPPRSRSGRGGGTGSETLGRRPSSRSGVSGASDANQLVLDIIQLLRKAGATEYPQRPESIMVGRGDVFVVAFSKTGHAENRYTLLEAIGLQYRDRVAGAGLPQLSALRAGLPGAPGGQVTRPALDFPDFSQVRIHRMKRADRENEETIDVNVEAALISADSSKDVALEWGDMVEIPEKGHKLNESWAGLPLETSEPLRGCLSRSVRIHVQSRTGETTAHRTLDVFSLSPSVRLPSTPPVAFAVGGGGIMQVASFHLDQVMHGANLLLTSSDQTRVKVTRTDPGTKQTKEIIVNLFDPAQSLWLRNGDVIEVPEKE